MKGSSSTCRLRKVSCPDCGYVVRMTRSWMAQGFPQCPCGGMMQPDSPADLAFLGMIGPDDMGLAAWNAICRENGWAITRNAGTAKQHGSGMALAERVAPCEQCEYPGCGRWVKHGETHCKDHSETLAEATPF